jgi:hypothetical protein
VRVIIGRVLDAVKAADRREEVEDDDEDEEGRAA